jgi:hypothetical protein
MNMTRISQYRRRFSLMLAVTGLLLAFGCYNTPIDVSDLSRGPAPLRMPSPSKDGNCCYEDSLEGGHIFEMYCGACHNMRALSERPFASYQNAFAHMRVRANLTGKEYAKLMAWMRRWYDLPPPVQHEAPAPRRFIFSQPIAEQRQDKNKTAPDLPAGPRPGYMDEVSSGQPAVGNGPREAR